MTRRLARLPHDCYESWKQKGVEPKVDVHEVVMTEHGVEAMLDMMSNPNT
jgi:hypothetical protein